MTDHVKIYGIKPRIQYVADGTLTEYEFPFAIFKTSDIDVYFADTKQESTSYTVSEARHSDGGTVTFETAPESGTIITIVRNLSIERTSDFQEGSTLRAKVLNDELDYQIACQQQIAENLNRSMVLPPYATDSDVDLTLPTPSAGKAIVWNSDGTNLENSEVEINSISRELDAKVSTATTQAGIATAQAGTATTQAQTATTQAGIATTKAEIATQKATEVSQALSTKANTDMDNLTAIGKTKCLQYTFPSTSYIEIPAPPINVEGSYIAPANGYIAMAFYANYSKFFWLLNASIGYGGILDYAAGAGNQLYRLLCPVAKGQTCVFNIESGSYDYIRFYYAQGEI